jgi:hypothetical protein
MKHTYTRFAEGQITYMVYTICSGENNEYLWVSCKVDNVFGFIDMNKSV